MAFCNAAGSISGLAPKAAAGSTGRRAAILFAPGPGGRKIAQSSSRFTSQRPLSPTRSVRTGTIRLSRRLVGMPTCVDDYVLLHELAHLLVPGHGPDFWAELAGYPRLERARGYLEGAAAAARLPGLSDCPAA